MDYEWVQTSPQVYRSIYDQHKNDFTVWESYTEMDNHGEKLKAQITAWGFRDAGCPLIKSDLQDFYCWRYYICIPVDQE